MTRFTPTQPPPEGEEPSLPSLWEGLGEGYA